MVAMPNSKSLATGRAEELPIPEWARIPFATNVPAGALNPLDMAAGARMTALNARKVLGIATMPWNKDKVARAGLRVAQGSAMVYSPVGYGQRYS